jgi:hypothetical protein
MQLRESLRNTASNSSSPNREYGWGIINALNAMYYYPIPVQFLNFSSSIQGKKVHLQWKTASEKNDSGFEVQRSLDQKGWVKVSFVRGAGTSTVTNSYSLDDIPGKLDKYYYRLKQIDFDGTFIYSNTISVDLTKNIDLSLSQNYPNPFNPETEISYTLPASGQVALQLYSTAGEKIREIFSGYQEKGEYSLRMALTDLASGIYFYQLIFTDQLYNTTTTLTKKLVLLR